MVNGGGVVEHLGGGLSVCGQVFLLQPHQGAKEGAPPAAGVHELAVCRVGDHHLVGVLVLEVLPLCAKSLLIRSRVTRLFSV